MRGDIQCNAPSMASLFIMKNMAREYPCYAYMAYDSCNGNG